MVGACRGGNADRSQAGEQTGGAARNTDGPSAAPRPGIYPAGIGPSTAESLEDGLSLSERVVQSFAPELLAGAHRHFRAHLLDIFLPRLVAFFFEDLRILIRCLKNQTSRHDPIKQHAYLGRLLNGHDLQLVLRCEIGDEMKTGLSDPFHNRELSCRKPLNLARRAATEAEVILFADAGVNSLMCHCLSA